MGHPRHAELRKCTYRFVWLLTVLSSCLAGTATAQRSVSGLSGPSRDVDGVWDAYRAALATAGKAPASDGLFRGPVQFHDSVRSSAAEHPWQGLERPAAKSSRGDGFTLSARVPVLSLTWNSDRPVPDVSGPVWTGRGLTAALRGGAMATWRQVFVQLEPLVWLGENRAFALSPNGFGDSRRFNDPRFPLQVDLPQAMGAQRIARLNPGNSTVAIRASRLLVGVTTAARAWGMPGSYPLLLGTSAGGFPHAFMETDGGLRTPLGAIHSQILLGRVGQSRWSPASGDSSGRSAAAVALSIRPRGLPGVEVGAARFLHAHATSPWPRPALLSRLFSTGYTGSGTDGLAEANRAAENNLASVYFRWTPPAGRISIGGEYLWEDYANDFRDLLLYPDDLRTFNLHASIVLQASASRLAVVDVELVNGELPSSNERRARTGGDTPGVPFPPYLHSFLRQGHTHLGLPLGSRAAYGGAASRATVRRYAPQGVRSLSFERQMLQDWRRGTRGDSLTSRHIRHSVAVTTTTAGRVDRSFSLAVMYDLNVNLDAGNDVAHLTVTMRFGRLF